MVDNSDRHDESETDRTSTREGLDSGETHTTDTGFASTPAFFFRSPVTPPQLENGGQWEADPLGVSGSDVYVDGEYLYQDYVYDDKGAATGGEPIPPALGPPHQLPKPSTTCNATGRVVYPTDEETYAHNAADLLEFRTRPTETGVAYRFTLQTMKEPDVAAVAVGIDTGTESGRDDWGYGIGSLGPLDLDHVLITWGTGAELDGEPLREEDVSVDVERNQIDVTVPIDPGEETWRHYAIVGLFDAHSRGFLQVQDQPTEDRPGGARGEDLPPVFNVAFRFDEPTGIAAVPEGDTVPGREPSGHDRETMLYGQWREHAQAVALQERDISEFHADIEFDKLRAGVDESDAPQTGYLNRVYPSRYELGEGIRQEFELSGYSQDDLENYDLLRNRMQPYALHVPQGYTHAAEHPLHIHLHGGSSAFNTIAELDDLREQLGNQRDALVLSPEGRGCNFYRREGELDVLEAIADVIAQYNVDIDRITLGGPSMGGGGTFRLASRYPDLFAKVFPIVAGCWPGQEPSLDSLRNVPVLMWTGLVDEIATPAHYLPTVAELQKRGYRHEIDMFLEAGHSVAGTREDWSSAKAFLEGEYLGDATNNRTPSHVTHTRMAEMEYEPLDLRHDGAYWVEGIHLADGAEVGTVDVRVITDGEAPPRRRQPRHILPAEYVSHDSGVESDPADHVYFRTCWLDGNESSDLDNGLDISLEGVSKVTLDLDGTDLDTARAVTLDVEAEQYSTLVLREGTESVEMSFPRGTDRRTVSFEG